MPGTLFDKISATVFLALFLGIVAAGLHLARKAKEASMQTQAAWREKGYQLNASGLSVQTQRSAPTRAQYLASTQRALEKSAQALKQHRDAFSRGTINALDNIAGGVGQVAGGVVGGVGQVAGGVVGGVGQVAGGVVGGVGQVAGGVAGGVGQVAGNVAGGMGQVAGNVAGGMGQVAGGVAGGMGQLAGGVAGVAGGVGQVAGGVGKGVGGMFGRKSHTNGNMEHGDEILNDDDGGDGGGDGGGGGGGRSPHEKRSLFRRHK